MPHVARVVDERELIEFETPYVMAEVFPGRIDAPDSLRRCSRCGADSKAWPASELTVIKHGVSNQPLGHLVMYCHEHLASATEWGVSPDAPQKTGPVCPSCFLTVPLGTGVCDNCGTKVIAEHPPATP